MKKEKMLEYSRALVPIKKKFYQKIIIFLIILLSVTFLIIGLSTYKSEIQNAVISEETQRFC